MSDIEHTPGPWRALFLPHGAESPTRAVVTALDEETPEEQNICVFGDSRFSPKWKANAKLVAAAPQMYEFIRIWSSNQQNLHDESLQKRAQEILSNIEGHEPK